MVGSPPLFPDRLPDGPTVTVTALEDLPSIPNVTDQTKPVERYTRLVVTLVMQFLAAWLVSRGKEELAAAVASIAGGTYIVGRSAQHIAQTRANPNGKGQP